MTSSYNTIPIIVVVFVLYLFSYLLVKSKKISLVNHKMIWNSILGISFLASAIFGLILAIQMDSHNISNNYRFLLWLHVETGIVMAVISIFHIIWHLSYYKMIYNLIFKKNEKL